MNKRDIDQDTPGRPKSSSSRQQTRKDQEIQSGSPELDSSKSTPRRRRSDNKPSP